MIPIQAGISLNNPHVKEIDLSKVKPIHAAELDEKSYQNFVNSMESFLESSYYIENTTAGHPAYEAYARVEVNGKAVAKLDNNGFTESSNGAVHKLLSDEDSPLRGPALAQDRAERIAQELGGEVVKSSSALTQAEFSAMPQLRLEVDYKSLRADPSYEQLQKTKQARTLFLAQQIGQDLEARAIQVEKVAGRDNTHNTLAVASAASDDQQGIMSEERSDAVSEFLDYMSKTPEERFRAALLAEEGLTEEQYAALPPEQKIEIEEKIRDKIEDRVEEAVGENLAQGIHSSIVSV
jgi:hypothetical protein